LYIIDTCKFRQTVKKQQRGRGKKGTYTYIK